MIGDRTRFIDTGLDELDTRVYICPTCKTVIDVPEEYNLQLKMFFPITMKSTICPKCGEYCDRKE